VEADYENYKVMFDINFLSFVPISILSNMLFQRDNLQQHAGSSLFQSSLGGCTEAIVKEIGNAKNQILVQAYSFTSRPIAKALLEAHKRGVKSKRLSTRANAPRITVQPHSWRIPGYRHSLMTLMTLLITRS
jgi:phosphatidylserine/phosphatidylglycerophosphate/cardiolipin synthase-like enzyme